MTSLESRLQEAFASPSFLDLKASLTDGEARITSQVAQAALVELIRLLKPARVLEIGTYFANTTRAMAEAAVRHGGSITTIDPFGGDRIPDIIRSWPTPLQDAVTFSPQNSMSHFASLEAKRTPTGRNAPFDLIFIDGHHSFEYAFFDLMSSALYLRPGGAIVVDNMEQAGPAGAVELFLARFSHWRMFVVEGHALTPTLKESLPGSHCAILLAPEGIEIGQIPVKFQLYNIRTTWIEGLAIPLVPTEAAGALTLSANLYALPYDLHITGKGMVASVQVETIRIDRGSAELHVRFRHPVSITPEVADSPIHLELELSFAGGSAQAHNPLVDASREIRIHGEYAMETADFLAFRDAAADRDALQTALELQAAGHSVPLAIEERASWELMRKTPADHVRAARICELLSMQSRTPSPALEAWALRLALVHAAVIDPETRAAHARRLLTLQARIGGDFDDDVCNAAFALYPGDGEVYSLFSQIAAAAPGRVGKLAERGLMAWPQSAVCLYYRAQEALQQGAASLAAEMIESRQNLLKGSEFLQDLHRRAIAGRAVDA